jgi:transposase
MTAFAPVLETMRWRGLRSSLAGPERRRRWSAEQKRAIVAESLAPGAVVTEIGRRAEIGSGQIYRWRWELGVGNGFSQVLIAPIGGDAGCLAAPAIEIEFAGKVRMRVPASIPAGLAAVVVKALSGR